MYTTSQVFPLTKNNPRFSKSINPYIGKYGIVPAIIYKYQAVNGSIYTIVILPNKAPRYYVDDKPKKSVVHDVMKIYFSI